MSVFQSARNPVLYIAEIGGNHEGDLDYAKRLNALAIASGADFVKHQIYTGDTLVSRVEDPQRNAHFKKFELGRKEYESLAAEVQAGGRDWMASVWNIPMLSWVDPLVRMHKVGSGDLTAYPMIRALVQTGKPLIVSTGLSTLDEVRDLVAFVERTDPSYIRERKLALLQCTSAYPCPDEDANLDVMLTLRDAFGLPVGYSDHTIGPLAVEAAVAMGAEIIEKHFTDTREGKTFRDHSVSLTSAEVQELMPRLARIRRFKGSGVKAPTPKEIEQGHPASFRRSVYAARPLKAGTVLTEADIQVLRPAHGISATQFDLVIGRTLTVDLEDQAVLKEDHLG